MARSALRLAALVAVLAVAYAQGDMVSAIKASGATRYIDLLKAAGVDSSMATHAMQAGVIMLVPTNAAMDAWLKAEQLSFDALAARKALAQRLVGYLTLLPDGKLKAGKQVIPTANLEWNVTLNVGADGKAVSATDAHDHTYKLTATKSPEVYLVSGVPTPGNVYPTLNSMDYMMHGNKMAPFTLFEAAVDRAGVRDLVGKQGATIFAPVDPAFKAAGFDKAAIAKADPAVLKRILGAHTINGYMPIPSGFKSGRTYQTLTPGATLTVKLQEDMMPGGYMMGHATVRDASGTTAKVIAPNQFTGLATVHAIDKVLAPPPARAVTLPARVDDAAATPAATTDAAPAATTTAPAATAAPAATTAVAAPAATTAVAAPAATTAVAAPAATTAAAPAATTAAAPSATTANSMAGMGRRLAQSRSAENASSFAANNARDAIIASLQSDSPTATSKATQIAALNAAYVSYPSQRDYYTIGPGGLN